MFMESHFASWMDRFELENPGQEIVDESDPANLLLQEKGYEHEERFLQKLKSTIDGVFEVSDPSQAAAQTLEAMRRGHPVIYQAQLESGNFAGRADFLMKIHGPSNLGDYHYEVWDTKLSRKPKPYFLIQLCCYSEMLEAIQGKLPEFTGIVLGDLSEKRFRTTDYLHYYRRLLKSFREEQCQFNSKDRPIPDGMADHGRWSSLAETILEDLDHLSRVANIRKVQIKKLERAQIFKLKELANSQVRTVSRMEPATFSTLRLQAQLQLESSELDKPKFELIPISDPQARRGLRLLAPASENDLYFDMEGYPHVEGGLEYLFGASYAKDGELVFRDFWAHTRPEEKRAFEDFIDWAYERWQQDPSMHIYHYADYEVSALRRLMGRHATRERELDALLRSEVFINLFTVLRQSMQVGTPSYSIKQIERLYRDKRHTDVATAMDSVVFYHSWLERKESNSEQACQILQKIREYNKDDCDSTAQLADWLRHVQSESNISWMPPSPKEGQQSAAAETRNDSAILAQKIIANLPPDPEENRVQSLLAHLLEFHWRESKPIFWAKYARSEMTEEQLIDDPNCLGGLQRTARAPRSEKKSLAYEYKFDASQDNKMDVGTRCFFAHDLRAKTQIVSMDEDKGLVEIKLGPKQAAPPDQLGLIPDEFVDPKKLSTSIFRTVSHWHATGQLPRAIEDLLYRRRPNLKQNTTGSVLNSDLEFTSSVIEAVKSLDNSTLCIQGPPGSGKTYTGAKIIVDLLAAGKRIGVTSNSHKAIAKLLEDVQQEASKLSLRFNGTKIQSDSEDFGLLGTQFSRSNSASDVFPCDKSKFQLIGGTAWAFSDESAAGELDYLFVDEAGQVSIANVLAMAPCTKNIILMGDHMQLSQPIKGTHPAESALSILEYLLQDKQTIPDDLGIFLGTTYRMHPDVCEFVSSTIYEGRLRPEERTAKRQILIQDACKNRLPKSTGILFVPVEHDGNTQASDEEAAVVAELVQDLLKCQIVENGDVRPVLREDILVIAPYNMQVRTLKSVHLAGQVGTVDKFQGQEAPVVIVSMCASDGNESARGLEFLLNKNRLNVAISRAKCLAIVVGNPKLARTACSRIEQMELVNMFCKIVETSATEEPYLEVPPREIEPQMLTEPEAKLEQAISQVAHQYFRLVIIVGEAGSGKTGTLQSIARYLQCSLVNVTLELSKRMLELTRVQRTRQVERLLKEIIAAAPGDVVLLDNLELLFDVSLEVEPLRLLQVCSRNRTVVASWSGTYINETLTYSEPGHPEFIQFKQPEAVIVPIGTTIQKVKESISR